MIRKTTANGRPSPKRKAGPAAKSGPTTLVTAIDELMRLVEQNHYRVGGAGAPGNYITAGDFQKLVALDGTVGGLATKAGLKIPEAQPRDPRVRVTAYTQIRWHQNSAGYSFDWHVSWSQRMQALRAAAEAIGNEQKPDPAADNGFSPIGDISKRYAIPADNREAFTRAAGRWRNEARDGKGWRVDSENEGHYLFMPSAISELIAKYQL